MEESKVSLNGEETTKIVSDYEELMKTIEKLEIENEKYKNILKEVNNYVESFKDPTLENILVDLYVQSKFSQKKELEKKLENLMESRIPE
jgi:predicted RNase H-like nuclease (RuvC/YqgF family)